MDEQPTLPDYGGACVSNVVPALLDHTSDVPDWLPPGVADADRVVLLVLDGLGWEQLRDRPEATPTLTAMAGRSITTVAPSTTATALTSISTGLTPGQHGVVGYRMNVDGDVLNVLRWSVNNRDARETIPPAKVQPVEAFLGQHPPVVTKADFAASGFTAAHLEGARFNGYRVTSTLLTELRRVMGRGEAFAYCYYEGIDKVSHEYGLGEFFDAELRYADRLVADILDALPRGTALVVTADHGQVDVGDRVERLHADVLAATALQSGEGRFRWLHARSGRSGALLDAATEHHGDLAWVCSREQVLDEGWFGPSVTDEARGRLGDVAVVARAPVAFHDPADTGPYVLVGRHGSLTRAEMLVPLLGAVV